MQDLLKSKKFQTGFTLIELLIVIAIIAMLVSFGAVAYSTAQKNARNSQRAADLQKISAALEQYYADHHFYPTTNMNGHVPAQFETAGRFTNVDKITCLLGGTIASNMTKFVNNWSCTQDASGNLIPGPYNVYLGNGIQSGIPRDPINDYYAYASNGQTYVLVTQCYEGTPSTGHLFTTSNPYYNEATIWSGGLNTVSCSKPWTNQYYITSPQG